MWANIGGKGVFNRHHTQSGKRPRELWNEVYYRPVEGRRLLFQAWLGHEVEPNLSR